MDTIVYRVRNSVTGEYLTRGGYKRGKKTIWLTRGAAANAWNFSQPNGEMVFSKQTEWVVIPFKLIECDAAVL